MSSNCEVVIWCRNWILYNKIRATRTNKGLWFDVEIGYYTTIPSTPIFNGKLWFDVEIGYYTTEVDSHRIEDTLWFDVEIGYYTT